MVLRVATFLCLVALVACQSGDEITPEVPGLAERFVEPQAMEMRRNHFYCLGVNETEFPNDVTDPAGGVTYVRWALFLQYPVLNYLDTLGKQELLNVTARLIQLGGGSNLNDFTADEFCIADIVQYGVSTYEESVLINFYFENSPSSARSVMAINTAFQDGFSAQMNNPNSPYVQRFLERYALVIDLPGASGQGLDASEDPTQRAVVLGSYVGNTDIDTALNNLNLSPDGFAENPDPINFGLEAGDIIFAVFGSIFLTIVGGLTVLGFCIHPFFLA